MTTVSKPFIVILLIFLAASLIYSLYHYPYALYVSPNGNNSNPGTLKRPLKSVSLAYRMRPFGGTIYLLPGIYREEIILSPSLIPRGPVLIQGLTVRDAHATIVGSESSSSTDWTRCTAQDCPVIPSDIRNHVFVGEWNGSRNPNILTETTGDGRVHQLVLARSPNTYLSNPDKYHEYWWTADETNASPDVLIDTKNDPGLQQGNFTTTPPLSGATALIMDGNNRCGTFLYERHIVSHNLSRGEIIFDRPVGALTYGIQENGIGRFTKYYIENAIGLLDTPGEWFYDIHNGKLYVWPLGDTNPSQGSIEIGLRDVGVRIDASNIRVDNVTIRSINDEKENNIIYSGAVVIGSTNRNRVRNISLTHLTIQYAGNGITVRPPDSTFIGAITIQHADISHTTKSPIFLSARAHAPTNIRNILITDSSIHDAATQYNEPGINLVRVSNVRILNNHLYDNTSYGVHITGYEKTGSFVKNIFVGNNRIERVCQNASACAALKFFGGEFSDTVASHNVLTDNVGWSYCNEQSMHERGFASGIFVSNASGIMVIDNNAVNNSKFGYIVYPRQIAATHNSFYRNRAENSLVGLNLETAFGEVDNDPQTYASRHDNTTVKQNVFLNNDVGVTLDPADPRKVFIDDNLYIGNTISMIYRNDRLPTVNDIQKQFPYWETHSRAYP